MRRFTPLLWSSRGGGAISPASSVGFALQAGLGLAALAGAATLLLHHELVAVLPGLLALMLLRDVVAWWRLSARERAAFARLVRSRRAAKMRLRVSLAAALPWGVLSVVGLCVLATSSGERQVLGLLALIVSVPLSFLVLGDRLRASAEP